MNLSKSVAELQREHVVLELECIDRMYLNAYVPQLTSEAGVAGFVRGHLGYRFASTKQVAETAMPRYSTGAVLHFSNFQGLCLARPPYPTHAAPSCPCYPRSRWSEARPR
jgi:hypothetical protein